MKRLAFAIGTLLLTTLTPALAVAQSFEGAVTAKIHSAEASREMHYLLRDGVLRIEMQEQGHAGMVMIVDHARNTNYVLMPARRMYMTIPAPTRLAEDRRPEIVRTGRKEKIAGYECEHWLIKDPAGDLDACVASGLGTFIMGGAVARESSWSGALRDQRGFPLKVARAGGATILEVTKIEPRRLDSALFAPPADYQKMDMPAGMPNAPRQRP